jgi:hypothetical protein
MGQLNQEWAFVRMGAGAPTGKYWCNRIPGRKAPSMRGNPFLNLHRAAEAAGYPALLIVSVVCLGLVVLPIALLALTQTGWVLALALVSLVAAVAVLAGAIDAAFSDYGEAAHGQSVLGGATPEERDPVAPLPRRQSIIAPTEQDRKAA